MNDQNVAATDNQQQAQQEWNGSQKKFSKNLNGLLRNNQQQELQQQQPPQQIKTQQQWPTNTRTQTQNFNNKGVNLNMGPVNSQAPVQDRQQSFNQQRKNLPKPQRSQPPINTPESTGRDQFNYNNNNNNNINTRQNNQRQRSRFENNLDEVEEPQVEEIEEVDEYELRRRMSKKRPNQSGRQNDQYRNRQDNQNELSDNRRFNNNNKVAQEDEDAIESLQEPAPRRNNYQGQSRAPSRSFDSSILHLNISKLEYYILYLRQ